tara:strand:+ start:125 stop:496 length:372 start_codon:yes stop_codon:yes gene_type:complete
MWKFLARRGSIGGTARWVAKCFLASAHLIDLDKIEKYGRSAVKDELQKIVDLSLKIRSTSMPIGEIEEINRLYQRLSPGLVNFTVAILQVEAGFFNSSEKDQDMFAEVIREELVKKGIGELML